MKYLFTLVSILIISGIFVSGAEAQLFNKIKKKAQEKLENKVEQKVDSEMEKAADRMVDDSWDAVFGGMAENGQPSGKSPFSLGSDITTEPVYNFDLIATMEITSQHKDGSTEPPLFMDMHYREGAQYTGTKIRGEQLKENQDNLFIIYDFKNSAMIMLMENEKDKFSFAYNWEKALDNTEKKSDDSAEEVNWDKINEWQGYKKIGSKTIAGYDCNGYQLDNENGSVTLWVTRDANFGLKNMVEANANAKQLKGKIPENYPYGTLMEMTSEDRESGDKTVMKITKVQKNANVNYVMAEYPNMGLKMKKE